MRSKLWSFIFLLFPVFLFAQNNPIQGYLKTADGTPVVAATVSIKNLQQKIIAYKLSDNRGYFKLNFPDSVQRNSLIIEVNHISFKKNIQHIFPENLIYNILMEPQEINLAEIEVKSQIKVRSKNDTVKYDVGSFSKTEDRTIGDVISRMPGMEVSESGQIKYNGQNISSLYINGDNLLDDKYAIGTKTIPFDMVKTLEVLRNHQPTKVLQNKTLSDKVAVNLVIKDEVKTKVLSQLKIGLGLPKQYDGELNTILFNNKIKTLSVIKANNIGIDLSSDFTGFNFKENLAQLGVSLPSNLLSLGTVGYPPLSKQRYYFNNSGSLNTNNLINLKDSLQLKLGINLLLDKNSLGYNSRTDTYLPNDTISYTEFQNTTNNPFLTELTLSLEANKSKYFLSNNLNLIYNQDRNLSNLISNNLHISQIQSNRVQSFSNTFSYIPEIKKDNTISFSWYLSHYNSPQTLFINPGVNENILNFNQPYNETSQRVEIPTWHNRISMSYIYSKNVIKHTYEAGLINEVQDLLSDLSLIQNDGRITRFTGSLNNNLQWNRQQIFASSKYEYKKERWEGSLSVPISLQSINYKDLGFNLNENQTKIFITPNFRAKYFVSAEDFFSFNYNYANQLGDITNIYHGIILRNYRSLQANNADLQQKNTHQSSLQFNLQKSAQMLFINAGVGFDRTFANTLSSSLINSDIVQTIVLPINNNTTTLSANFRISKFIKFIGSTANLILFWTNNQFNQIQNNQRFTFNNNSLMINPSIEIQLLKSLRLKYNGNGTWITSKQDFSGTAQQQVDNVKIKMFEQAARFTWLPFNKLDIWLNVRHNYTQQVSVNDINYLFLDASMRYRLSKRKVDLELNMFNLTNIKSFETYILSSNSFWRSRYDLRDRMILFKAIFTL